MVGDGEENHGGFVLFPPSPSLLTVAQALERYNNDGSPLINHKHSTLLYRGLFIFQSLQELVTN